MKYIKTFEDNENFKFEIGDKVVCIQNSWPIQDLELGETYIVVDRKIYSDIKYYAVSDKSGKKIYSSKVKPSSFSYFGEKIFVTPVEYNSKKYNI